MATSLMHEEFSVTIFARLAAASLLLLATPLRAQPREETSDRLLLRAEDTATRDVSFVIVRRGERGGALRILAEGLTMRGDTLTVRVNPAEPAVVLLPTEGFRAELRAVLGGPALSAQLVTAADPTRRTRTSARGPVLHVGRDSVLGALFLGASAR